MHPINHAKTGIILTLLFYSLYSTAVQAQGASSVDTSSPAAKRRAADAAVDRNIVLSSAETVNRGDLTFNSYELFLAGFTYGFTDTFQMTATTLLPITTDIPFVLLANGKLKLLSQDNFVFSLQPAVSIFHESGTTGGTLGVSFLVDFILGQSGHTVITLSEMTSWAYGGSDDDFDFADGILFALSAGINHRVHEYVKLMLELILPGAIAGGEFKIVEEAFLANYGVRFFGKVLAVDLTFLRPLHPDANEIFVMGLPFVTFSARF